MVRWTNHAKDQLRHIYDYIAQDSPFYARRVVEDLVQKTLPLDKLPRQGKMVPELKDASIRELPLYAYRILYEIKANNLILVLAVIHKRRDLSPDEVPREEA